MIDDDDAMWVTALMPDGMGWIGILIIALVCYQACQNDDECSKRHCDRGSPVLMHHECRCVENAK